MPQSVHALFKLLKKETSSSTIPLVSSILNGLISIQISIHKGLAQKYPNNLKNWNFEKKTFQNSNSSSCLGIEVIAKLALEAKFDDFGVDSVSRKLTYPVGHRRFARNLNQRQKRKFGPKWSFAIAPINKAWRIWIRQESLALFQFRKWDKVF